MHRRADRIGPQIDRGRLVEQRGGAPDSNRSTVLDQANRAGVVDDCRRGALGSVAGGENVPAVPDRRDGRAGIDEECPRASGRRSPADGADCSRIDDEWGAGAGADPHCGGVRLGCRRRDGSGVGQTARQGHRIAETADDETLTDDTLVDAAADDCAFLHEALAAGARHRADVRRLCRRPNENCRCAPRR